MHAVSIAQYILYNHVPACFRVPVRALSSHRHAVWCRKMPFHGPRDGAGELVLPSGALLLLSLLPLACPPACLPAPTTSSAQGRESTTHTYLDDSIIIFGRTTVVPLAPRLIL